ncbi:glycosyltransferase [Sorangium sp. So ce341]|uniref:glycosyltransferase n=1 Tax=Sorangium sp. So ce341 TaxID=3133302 RepID=UPI003F5FFC68
MFNVLYPIKVFNQGIHMLPGILVLNKKYWPKSEWDAFNVGATSFALETMKCLMEMGCMAGLLFYRRNETIAAPYLEQGSAFGAPCVTMHFHFRMDKDLVTEAVREAVAKLMAGRLDEVPPVVYYHTDTLLTYHPEEITACVTHHGPFVKDFADRYSLMGAYQAFEGREKAEHLLEQQEKGLRALRRSKNVWVLQHSSLQASALLHYGVEQSRILEVSPPIVPKLGTRGRLRDEIATFVEPEHGRIVLLSAVARVDYFKHLEMLIDAGVVLAEVGMPVSVLVAGGTDRDVAKRNMLRDRVPERLRGQFLITEKLPQDELYALFASVRGRGMFVCTSRYETLGITPMEAALSGVCTLMPELDVVEATRYFPGNYRYTYTIEALVGAVERLYREGKHASDELLEALQRVVSAERFKDSLREVWETLSWRTSRTRSSARSRSQRTESHRSV